MNDIDKLVAIDAIKTPEARSYRGPDANDQGPLAGTFAEEVLICRDPEAFNWDQSVDVLVAGVGGAGVSAAIEARDRGCEVLAVDRFGGGGATAYSGGIYYAGATEFLRQAGFDDSVEEMYNYLVQEVGTAVSDTTLRKFCEDSPHNMQWLLDKGVRFSSACYEGKATYPPDDKYLYYAGNEKVPAYASKAKPAPRGHRAMGKGFTGKDFFASLKTAMLRSGVKFWQHAKISRLVLTPEGTVVGAEIRRIDGEDERSAHQALYARVDPMKPFLFEKAEKAILEAHDIEARSSTTILVRARKGVILATGAFSYNSDMLRRYTPKAAECLPALMRLGSIGCDGSGVGLGLSAGGTIERMEKIFLGQTIAPPAELVHGVMVNDHGERFVNEDIYTGLLGNAILNQRDAAAWLIIDNQTYYRTLRQCLPNGDGSFMAYKMPAVLNFLFGGTKKARSLPALSRKCGFVPGVLERTVKQYNDAYERGVQDPGGKNRDYVRSVGKGPYRAVNCAIGNKFSFPIFFTLGGLVVDEASGHVVDRSGRAIPGLYAAGRAAVGICSENYFSGMSLADCVFSGRRAAADAARATVG